MDMSSRTIDPPLNELSRLRTPLTSGERAFLYLIDNALPPEWSIFVQPHLNGLRPDFVLLNPAVGIAVFEVKDWDLRALRYEYRVGENGKPQLWASDGNKRFRRDQDDPVRKVDLYKREILDLYCPSMQRASDLGLITAGLVFPFMPRKEVERLFSPMRQCLGHEKYPSLYPLIGAEDFEHPSSSNILPASCRATDARMSASVAKELQHWPFEPEVSREQRRIPPLDARQRELATTRTTSGYRRIKGPAGSGKSVVLAARASELLRAGKRVLVVSYNITLRQYLRDTTAQFGIPKHADVEWHHFHDWCKRICYLTGYEDEYSQLWKSQSNENALNTAGVLDDGLASLVSRILQSTSSGGIEKYDAILVDEGQDFRPSWWAALRLALKPGGEALLVADLTQDVYGRGVAWTEGVMSEAGFAGRWAELRGSYRLPTTMLPLAQDFAKRFLPQATRDLPDSPEGQLSLDVCAARWIQVNSVSQLWSAIKVEIDRLLSHPRGHNPAVPDITIVTQTKVVGREIVASLQALKIDVLHTFDGDPRIEKKRKLYFFKGHPGIKVTTVRSFKGWESPTVLIALTDAQSVERLAEVYIALTRVKRTTMGSNVIAVCADARLRDYGRTWPSYCEHR